jgi:hypothetical protein
MSQGTAMSVKQSRVAIESGLANHAFARGGRGGLRACRGEIRAKLGLTERQARRCSRWLVVEFRLSRKAGRTIYIEDDLWQAVKTSIDAMPRDTARAQEHYARVRWLISRSCI